jgi:hypothetical protein
VERGVLPLATSVDGRQFTFQASLHDLLVQTGGYVVLEGDGQPRLGQVLTMRPDSVSATDAGLDRTKSSMLIRLARGDGVILDGDLRPFHDAVARPAEPPEVDAWLERIRPNRSALTIGDLLLAPGVAAALDAGGFNRHSFMCGQSGSGKTYSLGLVLETPSGGHESADGHSRSQLRLRPLVGGSRRHRPSHRRGVRNCGQRGVGLAE